MEGGRREGSVDRGGGRRGQAGGTWGVEGEAKQGRCQSAMGLCRVGVGAGGGGGACEVG